MPKVILLVTDIAEFHSCLSNCTVHDLNNYTGIINLYLHFLFHLHVEIWAIKKILIIAALFSCMPMDSRILEEWNAIGSHHRILYNLLTFAWKIGTNSPLAWTYHTKGLFPKSNKLVLRDRIFPLCGWASHRNLGPDAISPSARINSVLLFMSYIQILKAILILDH